MNRAQSSSLLVLLFLWVALIAVTMQLTGPPPVAGQVRPAVAVIAAPVAASPAVEMPGPGNLPAPCPEPNTRVVELLGQPLLSSRPFVDRPVGIDFAKARIAVRVGCTIQSAVTPPAFAWSVVLRPLGSAASLVGETTLMPSFTPDRAGKYTIRFVACPRGCRLSGGEYAQPMSTDVDLIVPDSEFRLSSDVFSSAMLLALAGTRVQVSHTGAGEHLEGHPYTVVYAAVPPGYKVEQICGRPPDPDCLLRLMQRVQKTYHEVIPVYASYIRFTPGITALGGPDYEPLYILPDERNSGSVGTLLRIATAIISPLYSVDIDRFRSYVNNIHAVLGPGNLESWIGDGGLFVRMRFVSNNPTIKCEGHWVSSMLWSAIDLDSGWADEDCPDFNLRDMALTAKLVPMVDDQHNLVIGDVDARLDARIESTGLAGDVALAFEDLLGQAKGPIEAEVRRTLERETIRRSMARALRQVLEVKFGNLGTLYSARVEGGELVVESQRTPAMTGRQANPGAPDRQ